ncbi:MAG TPA: DUF2243 domain-containing protein [Gemmatimonadales bacterium]|nr:DUF2243 domain-containing protein [Gemmatimonadales bacterium]
MGNRTGGAGAARRGLLAPGLLLGLGLGAFLDGIVLHQILQWHNMLSGRIPPSTPDAMRLNMRADGVFHLFAWAVTLAGVGRLWRSARRGPPPEEAGRFVGRLVLGWGAFNLLEGLINHQLLGLHHVREGADWLVYDLAFVVIGGLALIALGLWMSRHRDPPPSSPGATRTDPYLPPRAHRR